MYVALFLEEYCRWGKLRMIRTLEILDDGHCYDLYKVQRQRKFLWHHWWYTELETCNRSMAKRIYNELKNKLITKYI